MRRSGLHQSGNHFLAHERLAIIDPTSGDQPLFNEDKTISVTVNGEIYNYKDLMAKILEQKPDRKFATQSDCEVGCHNPNWDRWHPCSHAGLAATAARDTACGAFSLAGDA